MTMAFPPSKGGIQTYSRELAVNLVKKGFNVIVLTVGKSEKSDMHFNKIIVIRCPKPWKLPIFGTILFLFLYTFHTFVIVLKYRPKIIHAVSWFPCGFVALFMRNFLRIPYVVSAHGLEIYSTLVQANIFLNKLMKIIFEGASGIIAVSKFTRKLITYYITRKPDIKVIPPFFPNSTFSNKNPDLQKIFARLRLSHPCLLTVGRLIERKGHDAVIKALPTISKKYPNVIYLVVGDGPNRKKLEKLAKDLGVADKIIFTGEVRDQALLDYYYICDIFVMPCREIKEKGDIEGFGIVFLEAMFFGKPVIAGCSGGAADPVINGVVGFLVNPYDPEEIAERVIQLLSDKNLYRYMSENARRHVVRYYGDTIINEIIKVYRTTYISSF
jgi:phosphatidylinositol alpha-1,6-mannosyltransferase